ncbi:DGQHR domain-containing protein [Listeria portnoyi]|uniref:DGQHR domain-containing protein n=1 Tax=Listeria portnoyi TaxID=2713504 RepID=UPI001C9D52C5|nr:DGQHR domain-containing protein [Listeria portnoyi]
MDIKENLVVGKDLMSIKREKNKSETYLNIPYESREKYELDGWIVEKELRHALKMKKTKSFDEQFENKVWLTFCSLGFQQMNRDRNFKMPYSPDHLLTQQIDVFAADDETAIFIECKATETENKKSNFKEAIEAINGKMNGIRSELNKAYPDKKLKIKFIFATKNYNLSEQDKERLKSFHIEHFDENMLEYYTELAKHLGAASRYQLLGTLFENKKIDEIENVIPAIRGSMGGHTYYSFSIEPEKLLKLGYVLHRNSANKGSMPAYQRIIKKQRLNQVQEFVNNGGFFPNSIVINIDSGKDDLKFELAPKQPKNSISKLGMLHLPQKYKSVYIIDGQHRLYGYSDSHFKETNSIPVVAFLNLEQEQQVKLFMEINENQKAVSKNLRNTLNSDLLWASPSFSEQRRALSLRIAQSLGEDRNSPLYNRVIIGENSKTSACCITIDTIKTALDSGNFMTKFDKKNEIESHGSFDKGTNDSTYPLLYGFLMQAMNYISANSNQEWDKGESDNGVLSINVGIYAVIKVLDDIIEHLRTQQNVQPINIKNEDLIEAVTFYLKPLCEYFNTLSDKDKVELRTSYGGNGRTKYWRKLQRVIASRHPEFNPKGLDEYWEDNLKKFNVESEQIITSLEKVIKTDVSKLLEKSHGSNWFIQVVPKKVYDLAIKNASDKNYTEKRTDIQATDCLTLGNYRDIMLYKSNWRDTFEKKYTRPEEIKISGGKTAKTEWLQKVFTIQKKNFDEYSVTTEEYKFLVALQGWLLPIEVSAFN